MEKSRPDIDSFFKEKISDYGFPEKKGNWELMNHLLNARQRKKKNRRIVLFLSSCVLILTAGWFLLLPTTEFKNKTENNDNNSEIPENSVQKLKYENISSPHQDNANGAAKENKTSHSENADEFKEVYSTAVNSDFDRAAASTSPGHDIPGSYPGDLDKSLLPEKEPADPSIPKEAPAVESRLLNFNFYAGVNMDASGKSSADFEITNIGEEVNSSFADYAAVISADGTTMLYTSRRPFTEKEKKKNKESKENIYSSRYDPKTKKWSEGKRLSDLVNEPGRNNSAIALSNDGQTMLLYRDDVFGNGDIFQSTFTGKEWTEPVQLPEPVNSPYHESSANFSPDGSAIYFCSTRPGGFGGRDIWYCALDKNGNWGKAVNMGEGINTKEDEESIFIHPDGKTIYFSSRGHNGLGGHDIYKSVMEKSGMWSAPVNLGAPFNTPGDDVYFVTDAKGETGYFASSKQGGSGEKDLYMITPSRGENKRTAKDISLNYMVSDPLDRNLAEASIEIVNIEDNEIMSKLSPNSLSGKYFLSLPIEKNYGIFVHSKGYLFHSENFRVSETNSSPEINKAIELKKIEAGNKIILNNIFYETDKAALRKESVPELQRIIALMNEYPSVKVEISNHTNTSTGKYDEHLSLDRAQVVVDYLVGNGIDKNRLVAKGFGESIQITADENHEGQLFSFQTELKILAK